MVRITPSRIEYLAHGLNFASFCTSSCVYCYMNRFRRVNLGRGKPVDEDLEELARQLETFTPKGDIMMSTSNDPFTAGYSLANRILSLVVSKLDDLRSRAGADFNLRVLSKKGVWRNPITREPLPNHSLLLFGQTVTTLNDSVRQVLEPGAAPVDGRIEALRQARQAGFRVWLSVEPVFEGMDLLRLCELVEPEEVWVGKLNHYSSQFALPPEEIHRQVEEARASGFVVREKRELREALKIEEERKLVGLETYLVEAGAQCRS